MRLIISVKIWFFVLLCFSSTSNAQFLCDQSIYAVSPADNSFQRIFINPSNNALVYEMLNPDLGVSLEALSFNHVDDLCYALEKSTKALVRIDENGQANLVSNLNLSPSLNYHSGAMDRTGRFLTCFSDNGEFNEAFVRINIETFEIQEFPIGGRYLFTDFTIDPFTNRIYAYDSNERRIVSINISDNQFNALNPIDPSDEFGGVFSDAHGRIWAIGSTANGVASGLFRINKNNGTYTRWVTGPESFISDVSSCSFGVLVDQKADPVNSLACSEIDFVITLANASGTRSNLDLECDLPFDFTINEVVYNPFEGDVNVNDNRMSIRNLELTNQRDSIVLRVESGEFAEGEYAAQSILSGLPARLGGSLLSDDPRSRAQSDSTDMFINRIEEDSLYENRFLCLGDVLELDVSDYTNQGNWQNGSADLTLPVTQGGVYNFNAQSNCQNFVIQFDVVLASCPFIVGIDHFIEPPETFPCSEVVYNYIFENGSGVFQYGLEFKDLLPEGFRIIEPVKLPSAGKWVDTGNDREIYLEEVDMRPGLDTLQVLVEVGNISMGEYPTRARLEGFPVEIGPFRESDDPNTPLLDSTYLIVVGTDQDSNYVERILCKGETIELDASEFGITYEWENGSTDSLFIVDELGVYELKIFSGCDVSFVFFEVVPGPEIDVIFDNYTPGIFLGDSLFLSPQITNEGDSLSFEWFDIADTTLRCFECLETWVRPFFTNEYKFIASNEICKDSSIIEVRVDNTRRIYTGNIFSPNNDGVEDDFYLQTPDYTVIREFIIYNRWGNIVFSSENPIANDPNSGWDGYIGNLRADAGVYTWYARMTFLDGLTESFAGTVTLIR